VDVAVVTGAGRGLGEAIASRLASRGLAVLATDVDGEAAERTAVAIGPPAWSAALDAGDAGACRDAASHAASRGRLAVWVNNAGVLETGLPWEQSDASVERMAAVNLLGVIHGSRAAIAQMGAEGGRILNVASLSSLGAVPGLAVYGATKHGVLAFSLSLQGDLRNAGLPIEVRALCPDAIGTRMIFDRANEPSAILQWTAPRILDPNEVAARAVKLLYGKRLVEVMPASRGTLTRLLYRYPRVALRLYPAFRALGERNRRRWHESAQ